jgi:hypothetical protein
MGVKRPGEENAPEEPAKRHADGASKPLPAAHLPPSAETRRMLLRDSGWPLDVLNDPAKQVRETPRRRTPLASSLSGACGSTSRVRGLWVLRVLCARGLRVLQAGAAAPAVQRRRIRA